MKDSIKKQLIEVLKDQKEIFGDELFEEKYLKRKTLIITEPGNEPEGHKSAKLKSNAAGASNEQAVTPLYAYEKMKEGKKEEFLFVAPKTDWELAENLVDLNNLICNCQKCPLGATRNKFVFGSGNPNADVLVIGEGPGADKDAQGLPFVGRAGRLLTDILKAINFSRDEVYIANIVKCRPPGIERHYHRKWMLACRI